MGINSFIFTFRSQPGLDLDTDPLYHRKFVTSNFLAGVDVFLKMSHCPLGAPFAVCLPEFPTPPLPGLPFYVPHLPT